MKPVLVGESNPQGNLPLVPWPDGCAGHRLCNILGMTQKQYINSFERVNLLDGYDEWNPLLARMSACKVGGDRLILLGTKVARAFGLTFDPFKKILIGQGRAALMLPHPSGRCRIWNESGSVLSARLAVWNLCPEIDQRGNE